jgi:MSHA biogenesis protein MshQ
VWTRKTSANNGELCLYIDTALQGCSTHSNGELAINVDATGFILGQEQDSLGGEFDSSQAFSGLLDEVLLFDRVLSTTEINDIYTNQNAGNNYDGSSRECDTCDSILGQLNAVGIRIDGGGSNSQINTTTEALTIYAGWLAAGSPASGLITGGTYNVAASGTSTVGSIDFGGSSHDFSGTLPYPGVSAGVGGSDFLVHTSGTLSLPAGTYTIYVDSDDGFSFIMDTLSGDDVVFNKFGDSVSGQGQPNELRYETPTGSSDTGGSFTLTEDSLFDIAAIFFERGGGDYLEISIAEGILTNAAPTGYEILEHGALNGKVQFGVCVGPIIDHYQIEHNGNGLTCSPETITIKACMNSACSPLSSEAVSLDFQSDGITKEALTFTGSTTVSLSQTIADTLTLGLINETIPSANATVCIGGNPNLCDIVFADTGFRFYKGGETDPIPTQMSAKPSNILNIQAIKKNPNTGACQAVFIDTTVIEMAATCVDPTACAGSQVAINTDNITTLDNISPLSYSSVNLDFNDNTVNSAEFILTYPDAGKIQLHARYNIPDENGDPSGNYMLGSSNEFVVRPFGVFIDVVNNPKATTATEAKFIAAGAEFTTIVKAVQWQADNDTDLSDNLVTKNFGSEEDAETVKVTPKMVLPNLSTFPVSGVLGSLSGFTFNTFSAGSSDEQGIATNSDMTYSEVGIISFTAKLTDNSYLGADDVVGNEPYVGRFIPDHFVLVKVDGDLAAYCENPALAGDILFAYSGQMNSVSPSTGAIRYKVSLNPSFTITAKSLGSANTTVNYTGDFMKLIGSSITRLAPSFDYAEDGSLGTKLALTANLNNISTLELQNNEESGVITYAYKNEDNFVYHHELNAEINKFTTDINLPIVSVIDPDDVTALDADGDFDNDGDLSNALDSVLTLEPVGVEIRFGRAQLENSYGPETSNLPQSLSVNYFKDGQYIVADDDKCTPYNGAEMSLTNIDLINFSLVPALPAITPTSGQFIDGTPPGVIRAIELTAPGASNTGQVCVSYDIFPWLQYKWATDPGNLQCPFSSTDVDGLFNDNPFSIATFGIFRGNDRIIYQREIEKIN